ncbi:hypothetical protein HF896_06355 [Alicycliphilus denitrificans]|uniref:Uncharacterized protein n=2 Tax=Alicycliphilus denitrificans TaxID=179636 RepID=A0A858ZZK3_9BURK|nr:hypothetical protein HF896_06355 [Alicycliphilus denitrificans]
MLAAHTGRDSPDFRFLDFQYRLNGKLVSARNRAFVRNSEPLGFASLGEESTRVGDTVYIKWLHKPTGAVYENTIDLRGLLPAPVKAGSDLYFVLAHETVHVYLVDPPPPYENRKPIYGCDKLKKIGKAEPTPDNRARAFNCADKVWKVYPEQKLINVPQEQP